MSCAHARGFPAVITVKSPLVTTRHHCHHSSVPSCHPFVALGPLSIHTATMKKEWCIQDMIPPVDLGMLWTHKYQFYGSRMNKGFFYTLFTGLLVHGFLLRGIMTGFMNGKGVFVFMLRRFCLFGPRFRLAGWHAFFSCLVSLSLVVWVFVKKRSESNETI